MTRYAQTISLVGLTLLAVLLAFAWTETTQQGEALQQVKSELAQARSAESELVALRTELEVQKKTVRELNDAVASLREQLQGRSAFDLRRGRNPVARSADPGRGPDAAPPEGEDDTIDVITAEVAQRLVDSPALSQAPQVPREALREVVADVAREAEATREAERQVRRLDRTRERARRYAQTLNLNGAQASALERALVDATVKASAVRERVRDGELEWSDARKEWESLRSDTDRSITEALGPELAQQVQALREEDEPQFGGRGGRWGGGGPSRP